MCLRHKKGLKGYLLYCRIGVEANLVFRGSVPRVLDCRFLGWALGILPEYKNGV